MRVLFLCALSLPAAVQSETSASFDGASASSVYSTGSFSADQALAAGSGYWCRFRYLVFSVPVLVGFVGTCVLAVLEATAQARASPGQASPMSDEKLWA